MTRKTLFEIALKIVGLLALWNFLLSLGGIITVFSIFTMFLSNGGLQNSFMGFIALNMLFTILIPGIIAFCCLFKTQKIMSILKLDIGGADEINFKPRMVYMILILVSGVALFMHGCANSLVYGYNRETKTESSISDGAVKNGTIVSQKETKNVNYLAFAEVIIGIMLFLKSAEITDWLLQRYGDDGLEDEDPELV
jgi:hypothetical protein